MTASPSVGCCRLPLQCIAIDTTGFRDELAGRLSSVLEVIYLIFNEGYSATAGDDWVRPALCEDALRLGRILAELMPREANAGLSR